MTTPLQPRVPSIALAFHSGMSRSNDFHGAAGAGVAIGVVAGELTMGLMVGTLPRYLAQGGFVFVDSGAFCEVKTHQAPDFERVLGAYELIAEMIDERSDAFKRLYVVAPDKVGDQAVTLQRLARYKSRICALIEAGVQMIVPIQCGAMTASQMLEQAAAILGTRRFVAGIPSNKAAMSTEECATLEHHSFHILGRVQLNEEQAARLSALAQRNPEAFITADANWLRSRIPVVCKLTERFGSELINACSAKRFRLPSARTAAVRAALQAERAWAPPILHTL